ncbi:MAG: GNAT family N-acetyltransferase [Bacteroidetes bacterium]|nr:GNAT family N-acetyltransferase [Bacteroidota bacterium]
MQIIIRQAGTGDADQIRFLFRDTVAYINSADYNQDEINVWSEGYKNTEGWKRKIKEQYFIVAESKDMIVGFSSIAGDGYLDFMYVHKDFQRNGIAKCLLAEIESHAKSSGMKLIFSNVSRTAEKFFGKNGFVKTGENINVVKGIKFVNSVMSKII